MMKKLLCLALSVLMLASAFSLAGCTKKNKDVEEDISAAASKSATTVVMWMVTEDGSDPAACEAVAKKMAKITKQKYKINLEIKYFTESEYYTKLEEAMTEHENERTERKNAQKAFEAYNAEQVKAYKEKGIKVTPAIRDVIKNDFYNLNPQYEKYRTKDEDEDEVAKEDETALNEDTHLVEIVYPKAKENQVDIIYFSGRDKYYSFIDRERLVSLNDYISTSSKILKQFIAPTLLDGVKVEDEIFAIPNNGAIGSYRFMCIDKEMFDKYQGSIEKIGDIRDLGEFFKDVYEFEEKDENGILTQYVPIESTFEECMRMLTWYWTINMTREIDEEATAEKQAAEDAKSMAETGKPAPKQPPVYSYTYDIVNDSNFSAVGTLINNDPKASEKTFLGFNQLLTNKDFTDNTLKVLKDYQFKHYFGEAAEGKESIVKFMKGDALIKAECEKNGYFTAEDGKKYYTVIVDYPEATEKDLYGNMFGVCSFSDNPASAMQIITLLNTNSEFRNLFQYGIEGVNYTLESYTEENGNRAYLVKRTEENRYFMDIEKTGNQFIAYPEEGMDIRAWKAAQIQNNDSKTNPLNGFDFARALGNNHLDYFSILEITKKSELIYAALEQCTTLKEIDAVIKRAKSASDEELYINDDAIKKVTNAFYRPDELDPPDTSGESPFTVYNDWLKEHGYTCKAK